MTLIQKIVRFYTLFSEGIADSDLLEEIIYELYDFLKKHEPKIALLKRKKRRIGLGEYFKKAYQYIERGKRAESDGEKIICLDNVTHLIHKSWAIGGSFEKFRLELKKRHWKYRGKKGWESRGKK